MKHTPPRILALQLKRIGDLLLTTPALRALKTAMPGARLTLVIDSGCRELAPALDVADEVLVFRRGSFNAGLWRRLLCTGWEASLDFTGNDRSALLSFAGGARERLAFANVRKSRSRPMAYTRFVESGVRERHTMDHYLDLVCGLVGDIPQTPPLSLHPPDGAEEAATRLLAEAGVTDEFLVLHPGSARAEKFWEADRWAEVATHCHRHLGLQVVLAGSRASAEQTHLADLRAALSFPVCDISGRCDLLTYAAVLRKSRLLLGVDSAPMHFAAALGTPQIVLFGPTNPFHWYPRVENATVLTASGDEFPFAPRHRAAPMTEISVGRVIRAVSETVLNPVQ